MIANKNVNSIQCRYMFQLILAVGTVLANLLCMAAIIRSKETRKLDYYLLFLQNLVEFIFSGVYNSVYSVIMILSNFNQFCLTQNKYEMAREIIEALTDHRELFNPFSINIIPYKKRGVPRLSLNFERVVFTR